jgi:predicted transposase YdaD
MNHDHAYKLLFSHPEMVEDLLRGFVHQDWIAQLDFSTLEKCNGSYVSDQLRSREDDVVWRIRLRDPTFRTHPLNYENLHKRSTDTHDDT